MLWAKKTDKIKSEEYEILLKKIVEINSKVDELQSKLKMLWSEYDNLRGKFNRKLSGLKSDREEEERENETNIKPFSPFIY